MILKSAQDSHENINPLQFLYPLLAINGIFPLPPPQLSWLSQIEFPGTCY